MAWLETRRNRLEMPRRRSIDVYVARRAGRMAHALGEDMPTATFTP